MPDLFGEVMLDAVKGRESIHYNVRDDGYSKQSSGEQYIAPFDDWHEAERLAIDYVRGRVLDIGCGAGRVALYLQENGLDVVAIDVSPGALEAAKLRGVENVQLMNAEKLTFPEDTFNTVILFGNNFGILGEPERVTEMLRRLHGITTKDAVILAGSINPVVPSKTGKHSGTWEIHQKYHEKNRQAGKPPGLIKLRMKYKDRVSDWWHLLLAEPELMSDIADNAGWKLDEVLGPPEYYVGVLKKR
jgi:SAM-dependent methyltransferase